MLLLYYAKAIVLIATALSVKFKSGRIKKQRQYGLVMHAVNRLKLE